jgi:hypothetical protein
MLWQIHHPEKLWMIMGSVGFVTTLALIWYSRWVYGYLARHGESTD